MSSPDTKRGRQESPPQAANFGNLHMLSSVASNRRKTEWRQVKDNQNKVYADLRKLRSDVAKLSLSMGQVMNSQIIAAIDEMNAQIKLLEEQANKNYHSLAQLKGGKKTHRKKVVSKKHKTAKK